MDQAVCIECLRNKYGSDKRNSVGNALSGRISDAIEINCMNINRNYLYFIENQVPHHHPWPESNALGEVSTTNHVLNTNFAPTGFFQDWILELRHIILICCNFDCRSIKRTIAISQFDQWFRAKPRSCGSISTLHTVYSRRMEQILHDTLRSKWCKSSSVRTSSERCRSFNETNWRKNRARATRGGQTIGRKIDGPHFLAQWTEYRIGKGHRWIFTFIGYETPYYKSIGGSRSTTESDRRMFVFPWKSSRCRKGARHSRNDIAFRSEKSQNVSGSLEAVLRAGVTARFWGHDFGMNISFTY